MNVREEDRRKTPSSSRGVGLAATAAIGLGVGAALYYFLSKGSPHQETENASSSEWAGERTNVLFAENTSDSDSYSTISEGTTSDTSIHDGTFEFTHASSAESNQDNESDNDLSLFRISINDTSNTDKSSSVSHNTYRSTTESYSVESATDYSQSDSDSSQSEHYCSDTGSDYAELDKEYDSTESDNSETGSDYEESDHSEAESDNAESDNSETESGNAESDNSEAESDYSEPNISEDAIQETDSSHFAFENASNTESLETGYTSLQNAGNLEDDSDAMEWDVTNTSIGIPSEERNLSILNIIGELTSRISPRKLMQEDRLSKLRETAFRERSWTLEECSICFDVMLQNQEIMTLSCTHNFHAQCIMPWLQEKQTCPNCRKNAE